MYILEISCNPGGCRKGDYYVRTSISDIWNDLKEDLASDPYVLLWYGEDIFLYHITDESAEKLDLHDYISVTWRGNLYDTSSEGIIDYEFSDGYVDIPGQDDCDYIREQDDSSMLFDNKGGDIQGLDIIFNDIPLVIHLDLPDLDSISLDPVPENTKIDGVKLPTEEGYHNYE